MSGKIYVDKNGKKKGPWSEEEDKKLKAYIERYGHWNWSQIPRFAGVSRCGKSCRLRWMNYLRPNIKHGNITKEEEDLIIKLHSKIGNKWSTMATKLPGRSDNEIKNYWNSKLRKRVKHDHLTLATPEPNHEAKSRDNLVKNRHIKIPKELEIVSVTSTSESPSSSSTWMDESPFSIVGDSDSSVLCSDLITFGDKNVGSFWTDPFVADFDSSRTKEDTSSADLDQEFSLEMITDDEFLWSTMDLYLRYHRQLQK